eukprot:1218770-Rhodomonas_salina.1
MGWVCRACAVVAQARVVPHVAERHTRSQYRAAPKRTGGCGGGVRKRTRRAHAGACRSTPQYGLAAHGVWLGACTRQYGTAAHAVAHVPAGHGVHAWPSLPTKPRAHVQLSMLIAPGSTIRSLSTGYRIAPYASSVPRTHTLAQYRTARSTIR